MFSTKFEFRYHLLIVFTIGSSILLGSCGQQADTTADAKADLTSPVQVTSVNHMQLSEYTELTAVSSYQQRSYVKATTNGYVQIASVLPGKHVAAGTLLFKLITKEARAIGNAVNNLDPGLHFSGVSVIRADQSGFILSVNHQKGDYVQDGEALAVISNQNSFVFLLDLPYEMHGLTNTSQEVELILPDGQKLNGMITGSLPSVDSLAQTQRMIIKVKSSPSIPEGLIAKVRIRKSFSQAAQVLPKLAVLSNESEDEFWVMKMMNDSTAIKVKVRKGIENERFIEILNPVFNAADRIVSVGSYGLADTAKVKVVKH